MAIARKKLFYSQRGVKRGPHSDETKKRISEGQRGKKRGVVHSEEQKRKWSEMRKGSNHPLYRKPSPNKGKPKSEETKMKMSKSKLGVPSSLRGRSQSKEFVQKRMDGVKQYYETHDSPLKGKSQSKELIDKRMAKRRSKSKSP